jgi:hypothetical protein
MGYVHSEYPSFSWSESRERRRRGCMRCDYFATFGQHNGWEPQAPAITRATWTLGKLTSLDALLGAVVHRRATELVTEVCAGRALPTLQATYAQCAEELNAAFHASKYGRQAFLRSPTSVTMLDEFFYRDGPSTQKVAQLRERLQRVLHHLLTAEGVWDAVRDAGRDVIVMPRFASFLLQPEGITIYASADLIFRRSLPSQCDRVREPWTCLDWKTSRTDGVVDQLLTYALAMRDGLGLAPNDPPSDTQNDAPNDAPTQRVAAGGDTVPAYAGWIGALDEGAVHQLGITATDVDVAAARIRAAIRDLQTYLRDPVVNAPLPIEAFPRTRNPARCAHCVYRGRCHPADYTTPWQSELHAGAEP